MKTVPPKEIKKEEKPKTIKKVVSKTAASVLKSKKEKPTKKSLQTKTPKGKIGKAQELSYVKAIGRRKTAMAEIKVFSVAEKKAFLVNGAEANSYFSEFELQKVIHSPFKKTEPKFPQQNRIEAKVRGGGKRGQAEALRLAISRALISINPQFKDALKAQGFLSRDPRMVERKKFGLKKARRAPQWSKR